MANTSIPNAAVEQFEANLRHAYQQAESRLMRAVEVQPLQGVTHYFDKLAAVSATTPIANTQTTETPNNDPGHTKRQVQPLTADWGTMAPWEDVSKMLLNPQSAYVKQGSMAIRRQQDDFIIDAFDAAALDIAISGDKSTDLTTSVTFPAGQVIDAAGAAGLTFEKLLNIKKLMDENEVPDEGRYICIGSYQLMELLNDQELTSADYNSVRTLVNGQINSFLGFEWIRSERLPVATLKRDVFAWHREAMGMAVNKDLMVRVAEDPMRRFNTRVYVACQCNAVRIWETGVVKAVCLES